MREDEAKRSPQALDDEALKGPKFEGANPRAGATKEAVDKDRQSMDAVMNNEIPPDPGLQGDYGKRAGEVPSQEPGNPKKDDVPDPKRGT
jgi:hypothetical protein